MTADERIAALEDQLRQTLERVRVLEEQLEEEDDNPQNRYDIHEQEPGSRR